MSERFYMNGEAQPWQAQSIAALLESQGKDPSKGGIAVALNGAVLPKSQWHGTALKPDDRIEIVTVFKGG